MKNILMIAFHYPPFSGGSGVHRTLKFSRYLPQYGIRPIVLTAHPRAYPQISSHQMEEIPSDVIVKRAFALDSSRHLSIRGSYIKALALPDRWVSWLLGAIPLGLYLVQKYKPTAIWSTYPIATAHLIGLVLKKMTGLPWVADFRDSMTEENYPRDPRTRQYYQWIEKKALSFSTQCIFTAPSTKKMYLNRYAWLKSESCVVIPNGFDEQDFQHLEVNNGKNSNTHASPIRLVHAGVIYPEERDPRPFFKAVARLKDEGVISSNRLRIELRGSGSEEFYSTILKELNITDIIHLLPSLPYRESLQDCAAADALLLFQGASCNHQIPAKAYEYLRLQKPVLALTDKEGDTAALLNESGGTTILDMMNADEFHMGLPEFFNRIKTGSHPVPLGYFIQKYSRESQAEVLASCLKNV